MADFSVTCADGICSDVRLHVPSVGPWFADCSLIESPPTLPTGSTQIVIGDVTLSGTIDAEHSGTFGAQTVVRVIAGGAGWGRQLAAKSYDNDAGTKASRIVSDAAAAVGEAMAPGALQSVTVGAHYARGAGPASRTIEDVAAGVPWWVDFGGVTQVGQRLGVPLGNGATVLDYDVTAQTVTLAVQSLNDCPIGAQLVDAAGRWSGALTVASLEVVVSPSSMRVLAWVGKGADMLVDTLRDLIARLQPQRLDGTYRYRVVQMNGDRVDLQAVSRAAGLPDLVTVDMWPGVSGSHAKLAKGTQVGVGFFDGARGDPFIHSFTGRAGPAAIPDSIELGGPNGALAARQGDFTSTPLPPAIFSGTIGGSPATGVLVFPVVVVPGTIAGGSAKNVRIA